MKCLVPVHVIDCNEQEIGTNACPAEIDSFERYCKIVQTLAEKIIRRSKMSFLFLNGNKEK
jgi:hypothetical protein